MKKQNGETEEYLLVDVYLWSRYEEAVEVVKENKCNQSMEIVVQDGEYCDGCYNIDEFTFSALCILGKNVKPAFNLAKIRTSDKFSADDMSVMFEELLNNLTCSLQNNEETVEESIGVEEQDDKNLIEEPVVNYEEKFNDAMDKLNVTLTELEKLKIAYTELKLSNDGNFEELKELRKFKQEIEYKKHIEEVDEALAPYCELENMEEYIELTKDKYETDLDDLIKNIKIFCFDNNIVLGKKDNKKSYKKNNIKIPVMDNKQNNGVNPEWNFMKNYR